METHYFLPRDSSESKRYLCPVMLDPSGADQLSGRLNDQHSLIVKAMGHQLLHSRILDVIGNSTLMADIGCGSGLWLQDFATQYPTSWCFGFDISEAQFPPRSEIAKRFGGRLSFPLSDMTDASHFPQQVVGGLDIASVRLMGISLVGDQWQSAVQVAATLLKPGGFLQWIEIDPCEDMALNYRAGTACPGHSALFAGFQDFLKTRDTSGAARVPELMRIAGLIGVTKTKHAYGSESSGSVHLNMIQAWRSCIQEYWVDRGEGGDWDADRLQTVFKEAQEEAENGSCTIDARFYSVVGQMPVVP